MGRPHVGTVEDFAVRPTVNGVGVALQGEGSGLSSGIATIDFGATPGSEIAEVAITGQAWVLIASSRIRAFFMGDSTVDHNAYEHSVAPSFVSLVVKDLVNGGGFTIMAVSEIRMSGTFKVRWEGA